MSAEPTSKEGLTQQKRREDAGYKAALQSWQSSPSFERAVRVGIRAALTHQEQKMSNRMHLGQMPERPDLDQLLVDAQKCWDAMTPERRKEMRAAQQKSWVVGELLIEHPEMTKAEADEIYEKVVLGVGL